MINAVAGADPVARRWRLRLPERLPNLKGKWLRFYTVAWVILLPIALAGAARGTYIFLTVVPMWSPYGISTSDTPQGVSIDSAMNAAARAQGIRAGDIVVAIDGWTLPATGGRAAARTRVTGDDTFAFADGDFGGITRATADRITDFATGDKLDLSNVDASSQVPGDQAFTFVGAGQFTHRAGELRYEQINGSTYISGDTNGDGSADFMIKLDGLHNLNAGDLVL